MSTEMPVASKTKIVLVEDHPIVRKGLAELINQEPDLEVVGEAEELQDAVKLIGSLKPQVVLVDLSLKGANGLDLLKILKTRHPKVLCLVLSMHEESLYAERSLRAGAKGYVMKQEGTEKVISAIRKVAQGEICVSEHLASKMLGRIAENTNESQRSPMDLLSDRELEVFQMIGNGLSTREIAGKLNLSIKTVESYREHLKEKLKLKNSTELVHQAVQFFSTNRARF